MLPIPPIKGTRKLHWYGDGNRCIPFIPCLHMFTLPEINIPPGNWWLENNSFLLGPGLFSRCYVSFWGVYIYIYGTYRTWRFIFSSWIFVDCNDCWSVVCLGKEAKVKKKGERDAHSLLLWSQWSIPTFIATICWWTKSSSGKMLQYLVKYRVFTVKP